MDVLLRTGAQLLISYGTVFEPVALVQNLDLTWSVANGNDGVSAIAAATQLTIAYIAAHRYFIGIGDPNAAEAAFVRINALGAYYGGEPMFGYKEIGLIPERLQNI
jgi:hypothetical protein